MSTKPDLWGVETEAQHLAALMTRTLPVTVASVALRDEPSLSLAVKAVDSAHPVDRSLPVGARVPLSAAPWHRAVFQRGEPVLLQRNGDAGFQREAELALIPNLSSMYLLPIRFGEDTVGVLGLGEMRAPAREPFSTDKQQRCRAILDEFVAATAHAWEARRLRRQVRVMSSLIQLVRGVATARSFQDILVSLASEAADWLGTPVRGALLRVPPGDIRLLAERHLPEGVLDDGGRQLVLAMTRTVGRESWPVSVAPVAEDSLDPLGAVEPAARSWTRVGLPLMRDDHLIGMACLYVEDEVRLADWELEALRRRGEIAALGVEALETARKYEGEQEWLRRVAFELLTGYRRALLEEVFSSLRRALPALLSDRLRSTVPELAQLSASSGRPVEGGQPDLVAAVVAEVSAVVSELWRGNGHSEPATMRLDVNEIVAQALGIAKMSVEGVARRRGIALDVHFQPSERPLPIEGSLTLVGALVHAIESAVEAMPEGGELHIRTSRENGHAVIVMEDSGQQAFVDEVELACLSPHRPDLAVGVVRSITHRHGGHVTLDPRGARGKALLVHLPVSSGEENG
jgi:signal transduction histidine kinase